MDEANGLINNEELRVFNLKSYLPECYTAIAVKGVLTGIHFDVNEKLLRNNIESKIKVLNIHSLIKCIN